MRSFRRIVLLGLSFVMVASFASCSSGKDPVTTLANDYPGVIQDKLGIDEDDIREIDPSDLPNANHYEGTYYLCTDGDLPSVDCRVYDNPEEAREDFENYYDSFTGSFDEDSFDGEYQCYYEGNRGYIVVDGDLRGVDTFGIFYATGQELYGGVYYSGNAVVYIIPRNEISNDTVEDVISSLELPMANGENTWE